MQPKYEFKMFYFSDRNRTKLRVHVLVDFSQISVMKSDYDFGSVNEATLGPRIFLHYWLYIKFF